MKHYKFKTDLFPNDGLFLDVGCGNGDVSNDIGIKRYHGFDSNENNVKLCKLRGLKIKKGDIKNIPYKDNTFSCVYCNHVLEHTFHQQEALKEMYRVLKPNGKLILFMPTPQHWYFYDNPEHKRPQTHGSLKIIAKIAGFKSIKTYYPFSFILPHYFRVFPIPFMFWEVGLIAKK